MAQVMAEVPQEGVIMCFKYQWRPFLEVMVSKTAAYGRLRFVTPGRALPGTQAMPSLQQSASMRS